MLKKAGIVVAVVTAGLLAVSPLALAGGDHDQDRGDTTTTETNEAGNNTGLVNVADNETNLNGQACNNDVSVAGAGGAVNEAVAATAGAATLLGDAESGAATEDNEVRECGLDNAGGDDSAEIG